MIKGQREKGTTQDSLGHFLYLGAREQEKSGADNSSQCDFSTERDAIVAKFSSDETGISGGTGSILNE